MGTAGDPDKSLEDDHYSPASPQLYYKFRLMRQIEFYQGRMKPYQRCRNFMHITMLTLAVISAIFASFDQGLYVTIMTGIASAIVSLREYSDVTMKIRRYSNTIDGIRNLQSYWNSIDEMEQSALKSVNRLVDTGEAIISQEMKTWFSTFHKKNQAKAATKEQVEDSV